MSHMVTYQSEDGKETCTRVAGLEEAVRLIEELRNSEGVGETHLYELQEVPIQFHTYYRVEVNAGPQDGFGPAPSSPEEALSVTVVESVQEPQAVDMDQPIPPENTGEVVETPTFGIFSRP